MQQFQISLTSTRSIGSTTSTTIYIICVLVAVHLNEKWVGNAMIGQRNGGGVSACTLILGKSISGMISAGSDRRQVHLPYNK